MTDEGIEKINEIKKKVFKHWNAENIYIERVPIKASKQFKKLAHEEFCGDYGMALRYLVFSRIELEERDAEILEMFTQHEMRLQKLEGIDNTANTKILLSGRKIVIPQKKGKEE